MYFRVSHQDVENLMHGNRQVVLEIGRGDAAVLHYADRRPQCGENEAAGAGLGEQRRARRARVRVHGFNLDHDVRIVPYTAPGPSASEVTMPP